MLTNVSVSAFNSSSETYFFSCLTKRALIYAQLAILMKLITVRTLF
jgi:hypothetical protein